MYGLLLECIFHSLKELFGEEAFQDIRRKANVQNVVFGIHQTYSESVLPRLARAAQEVTGVPHEELMESFGVMFVSFVAKYGYDRILKVLGRNLRDFMNNLDNLHEYLRFSYPKISPPSFFVTDESTDGLTLHYRSKRKGFVKYVQGQVRQVAKNFYDTDVSFSIIRIQESLDLTVVEMRVTFDNTAYMADAMEETVIGDNIPVTSKDFFELFPFHVVFNRQLVVTSVGSSLQTVVPQLMNSQLDDLFHLQRPLIDFTFESILCHTNNVFEMKSVDNLDAFIEDDASSQTSDGAFSHANSSTYTDYEDSRTVVGDRHSGDSRHLVLKGQMIYMKEWNSVLFLGSPVLNDLRQMFKLGLYITDLSIHDSSRDLILAGTQQSAELKLLLDQEQSKSRRLEESMNKLEEEMKRTDQLLYQMIPKSVADRLRRGEPAVHTCETFESCTVLFSDVVGFTTVCSRITPMQVVAMLNGMYTSFDTLIEKHRCYKVETIGDAYMIVGGVPNRTQTHAQDVIEMAFSMLCAIKRLKDPSDPSGKGHLKLRVGVHSGMVVAGVVGLKMPRYCLFGDTVNIASRMESRGEAMRIHLSESTRVFLEEEEKYCIDEHDSFEIKNKGSLRTYWISHNGPDQNVSR